MSDRVAQSLTLELISGGLSKVETTVDGGVYYTSLELTGENLSSLEGPLGNYTKLQCLDFRNNFLESLKPIEALPNLLAINCQNNILNTLEGFGNHQNLQIAQLDQNEVESLDSYQHPHLRALTLSKNRLRNFKDLNPKQESKLQVLDVSYNLIDSIIGVAALANLTILKVRGNRISSLDGIEGLRRIQQLDVRDNLLPNVQEVKKLVGLPHLKAIMTSGNEGMYAAEPLIEVVILLRNLEQFDDKLITSVERSEAAALQKQRADEAAAAAAEAAAAAAAEAAENEGDDE